jgi:hypothetical protein
MGIDLNTAAFLRSEHKRGVSFRRTLCIGRQSLYMTASQCRSFGLDIDVDDPYSAAECLFKSFGAETVDSIDYSSYEGANIIHDLNQPFRVTTGEQWSCVFDGGSLEHIFHFPIAIKSCLEATAVGGTFISITPWSGLAGHGFYQFSPELLYRILSKQNGFWLDRLLFNRNSQWYSVEDPKPIGLRLEFQTKRPLLLCVSACKMAQAAIFASPPQQSDYQELWSEPSQSRRTYHSLFSKLLDILKALSPPWLSDVRRRFWQRKTRSLLIKKVNL